MNAQERIDSYAKARGWTPDMIPKPPPEMTPRQRRRFMHKLQRSTRQAAGVDGVSFVPGTGENLILTAD